MVKQVIISVLEEVVGEYILNISKENLKIAALRGKVKLENVQLDGELIGSHVLGAMGLSGFGVLSCWARTLKMVAPLKNLEKEPTRFEIHGLHLVCVPLLPSTAGKLYGAGTSVDPRCTLRTRAKRSALARFERNYFSGRIPGEGPPSRRVQRAMRVAERELRKSKGKGKGSRRGSMDDEISETDGTIGDDEASDHWNEESFYSDSFYSDVEEKNAKPQKLPPAFRIPIVQQNWKTRVREKMLGNIEASVYDIHIRCEVSENGLEFGQPDYASHALGKDTSTGRMSAEQRAFSFGVTMKSFIIRSADDKWEVGTDRQADDSASGSSHGSKRKSGLQAELRRIGEFNDVYLYWDDEPPVLISETYVLQTNDHRLSPNKLQSRISAAMEAMVSNQDPGEAIRRSLSSNEASSPTKRATIEVTPIKHDYCVESFFLKMHGILGARDTPGPMTLFAEVLPVNLEMSVAPHQYLQYQKLRSAMLSQQRFDTMVHQRPAEPPLKNPVAWWKYAIACVITRPTSRPWSDVLRIVRCRKRYIELVKKKIVNSSEGNGYHAGLTDKESLELLALEDLLPVEALLAFHLLACRAVYEDQKKADAKFRKSHQNKYDIETNGAAAPAAKPRGSFKRLRRAFSGGVGKSNENGKASPDSHDMEAQLLTSTSFEAEESPFESITEASLLEVIKKRIGKKTWFNTFQMSDVRVAVNLLNSSGRDPQTRLELRARGTARTFGPDKRDFLFDIIQVDIIDRNSELSSYTSPFFADGRILTMEESHFRRGLALESRSEKQASNEDLPEGVVCRLSSSQDAKSFKLGISALPATFVWNKASVDAIMDFFATPSAELQTELTRHLRNAATPLARRAQLALLTPMVLVLNVDVAAPKVWLPISSENNDGALYLDAGRFKVACSKQGEETRASWEVLTRDIQVVFLRQKAQSPEVLPETEELRIVQPFHVHAETRMVEREEGVPSQLDKFAEALDLRGDSRTGMYSTVVSVSPICLNLVDAEMLARAIGQWYTSGLTRAKSRVAGTNASGKYQRLDSSSAPLEPVSPTLDAESTRSSGPAPQLLTVAVEKIEMVVEGHSKTKSPLFDDQSVSSFMSQSVSSLISQESLGLTPRKRTYVVEVIDVGIERAKHLHKTKTHVGIADASILQIKEGRFRSTRSTLREDTDRFPILKRGKFEDHSNTSVMSSSIFPSQPESRSNADVHATFGDVSDKGISPARRGEVTENFQPFTAKPTASHMNGPSIVTASFLHDGNQNVDEMEIEIDSIIVRVTPTTLKDCLKATRRVLEIAQLTTKEMERKVHEQGRKARQKAHVGEKLDGEKWRSISPVMSEAATEVSTTWDPVGTASDSSLLFKITLQDSTLLAGRSLLASSTREKIPSNEVIQVLSKSLIMFQSVENPDASGMKTLHVSLDNLSATVNTEFERLAGPDIPPMVGPSAAELRVVYATENQGCVVSQDVSVGCEATRACLTPHDALVMSSVSRSMFERLRVFGSNDENQDKSRDDTTGAGPHHPAGASLIRYQKKGTGIATSIQVELQLLSFVLLRPHQSNQGAMPLFDLNVKQWKGKLVGCMSALSGEFTAVVTANFFNREIADWEYAVEPLGIVLTVDQMPNELILKLTTADALQINLTSRLLKDASDMDFNVFRRGNVDSGIVDSSSKAPAHRPTESRFVTLKNESGIEIVISSRNAALSLNESNSSIQQATVEAGDQLLLDPFFGTGEIQNLSELISKEVPTLSLSLSASMAAHLGEREPVLNLPVAASSDHSVSLHRLQAVALKLADSKDGPRQWRKRHSGRNSPDTESHLSEASSMGDSDFAYYNAEPVIEWCMQNQRLRSSISDVFSLEKGRDILSSKMWSPEDQVNQELELTESQGHEPLAGDDSCDAADVERSQDVASPNRKKLVGSSSRLVRRSNWVRPYLTNDSPEWTDMTCILRMARERVMLPDNNWIWLNNWTVDLSGSFGDSTDADGWEYEADFETFSRNRRFYKRGDTCRRRRWTRTRIVRPPRFDDPFRQLSIVWETKRDDDGNFGIIVKSPLTIHNLTSLPLAFFAYTPSWDEDFYIGRATVGGELHVPVPLASAAYLRLGRPQQPGHESTSLRDYAVTERVMILPTSYTSSVILRTRIKMSDYNVETSPTEPSHSDLHFSIHVKCVKGVTDLFVEPVLRVVNLLPCQLQCEIGEVVGAAQSRRKHRRRSVGGTKGKNIIGLETITMSTGDEGKCTSVNPAMKPHLSLRVPGYQWSEWQRIVNRKSNSYTWQPPGAEDEAHIHSNRGDGDYAEEFKSSVRFERIGNAGDPLVLIVSVEAGHCPTVRIYAQYWILDKTGFGCRFCEGFIDLLGTIPDGETSRRSHLLPEEADDPDIQNELSFPGHQWSIGMNGMSLFFSRREKIALSIESGSDERTLRSRWIAPMDISNVIPKTVFFVDEYGGSRRFDLAISVTVCPATFARTKLITLLPRYQIVNLLSRKLVVAQDGCLKSAVMIPSQSSVPFHRERQSQHPMVRLGAPSSVELESRDYSDSWTNGCIQLDKIGITSIRIPTIGTRFETSRPMVVQVEVRLATKDQQSAVVIVIWTTDETSNPLYVIRNSTSRTILCRQPLLHDDLGGSADHPDTMISLESCSGVRLSPTKCAIRRNAGYECGAEFAPMIKAFLGMDNIEEFVWILREGDVTCFGFEDPEKPHVIEWTGVRGDVTNFDQGLEKAFLEIDAMGSSSKLTFPDGKEVRCRIIAEHSTKVIEFIERDSVKRRHVRTGSRGLGQLKKRGSHFRDMLSTADVGIAPGDRYDDIEEDEELAFSVRFEFPEITVSVIDNATPMVSGREILAAHFDKLMFEFSRNREGYHEFELRLMALQVDNHVNKSIHPVLIFCPRPDDNEPLVHMSAVRRLQPHSSSFVFRYAAVRVLEINIFLDRRTAETVARFVRPLGKERAVIQEDPNLWINRITASMASRFASPDRLAPRDIEQITPTGNAGRIYFEQLHLHPVRLALTFTQEWMEWNPGAESMMIFQFIRGMASIANAPLTFNSFVVAHVFESPQALARILATHYSSQLTKQIFGILGSLAILGAPADFISNVGTGVRDFFYEPINGLVHGPAQFIEGLEAGTQSLARGVFVGVVRGAANVTEVVNSNLAGLTADDNFINERKAHHRMLTDAMSRGVTSRSIGDSLYLAGGSIVRGVKSGALGIVEQPAMYASKHGPVGFAKGVGKALVGAIVKPVVGIGDAAVLVMNHVSETTSDKQVIPKIPKRLRRALPRLSSEKPHCVQLSPYDDRAAKAQKIVTGGESVNDIYIGHVNIPSHLIIASEQCLWAIDRRSREPWCVSWEEISHFGMLDANTMRITVFSQTGLKSYVFQVKDAVEFSELHHLLSMQLAKMGNATSNVAVLSSSLFNGGLENLSKYDIPGIKTRQVDYVFGSCNRTRKRLSSTIKDEIDVIEQCFARVKEMGSESSTFFKKLDDEAWNLVTSWGQVFSGLSSRRCIVASIINGTGNDIQIKSTKLVEGGSPCYSIPTKEYDAEQGVLHPGGAIIFFGWGVVPNLLQAGNVFMNIETNAFVSDLSDHKSRYTVAEALSGYQVGFLEKSYDESGNWWAKYWLLVRKA